MEYKTKKQLADEMVKAWEEFWKASEKLETALEDFRGSQIKDITNQRIHKMRSRLNADLFELEFDLNRLIEDEGVNNWMRRAFENVD